MASSNRHWPSMFKSKPCNSHHQWQHDINHPNLISSTGCHRSPYSSVTGYEERSPEPKPRWNPKPEQIRILEGIFNSGIVNPPREEIRKIRAQLQEYGQVGDANVFYWFQNRKSRSKHKLRHLQNSKNQSSQPQNSPPITALSTPVPAAPSSSSSSSDKTSPKSLNKASMAFTALTDLSNSPSSASVSQTSFHAGNEFLTEPFFFPSSSASNFTQGFCFSELSNMVHHHQAPDHGTFGPCTSLLLSDIINHGGSKKDSEEKFAGKIHPQLMTYPALTTHSTTVSPHNTSTTVTVPSPINQIQDGRVHGYSSGYGPLRLTKWPRKVLVWHSLRNDRVLAGLDAAGGGHGHGHGVKSTVFINDVAFEVPSGPLNVREAFGDDAVLIHSSGQPILTNEWGITLQSLSHGSSYYLI